MRVRRAISAAPDLALGFAFLLTWRDPNWLGFSMVRYAVLTMLLEFVVIHSSGFMSGVAIFGKSRRTRAWGVIGLGAAYTVLVSVFALAFGEWWPLWAFWALTLNRLLGVLLRPSLDDVEAMEVMSRWAVSVVLYLCWVGVSTVSSLPPLGVDAQVVITIDLPGSGLWIEEPHRALVTGAGYFTSQALLDLFGFERLPGMPVRADARDARKSS